MMNYFKDFQFIVFFIDTHAEIKTSIPAVQHSQLNMKPNRRVPCQGEELLCDTKPCDLVTIPFINNFISSPLYKITELGSTGKNHSAELTDYLVKKRLQSCKFIYQGWLLWDAMCSACNDHHYTYKIDIYK